MSREILFKAKRKYDSEWVEGDVIHEPIGMSIRHVKNGMSVRVPVDPDTLCQFTGLTDKNDKKIWENDICIIKDGTLDEEDGCFVCEWDNDAARFVLNGDGLTVDFDNCYGYDCEVIGNIFDNPELLEVE